MSMDNQDYLVCFYFYDTMQRYFFRYRIVWDDCVWYWH